MHLEFYFECHDFIVRRFVLLLSRLMSTKIYYMQRKCCVVFPFPKESLKNVRIEYICYIGRLPAFPALRKYSHYNTGYVMCFCCSIQEVFYVNIRAIIVKMSNV
jgi:hypothetical protein